MLSKVIVGPVRNAPELAPAPRKSVFDICRCLGIETELFHFVIAETQVFRISAQAQDPVHAELAPVRKPVIICTRLAEEFHFHLLKFTCTEDKVARCDLIAERFADLTDAERQLLSVSALYTLEVNEHTLCRFRSQVDRALGVFQCSLECLEHQVELTDRREIMRTAVRTRDMVLVNIVLHLLICPAFRRHCAVGERFDQLICSVSGLALSAVHQRIRESLQMSGSLPDSRIHQDRCLYFNIVRIFLYKFLLPCTFDVVFQHNAVRTVIPRIGQTAVNLGALEYKARIFGM